MARATTKADLTSSANEQFNKMWKLIDCMTKSQQEAAFAEEMATVGKETHWSRDKNLRDVLVHLYEWHQLLLSWIKANLNGEYQTSSIIQLRRLATSNVLIRCLTVLIRLSTVPSEVTGRLSGPTVLIVRNSVGWSRIGSMARDWYTTTTVAR